MLKNINDTIHKISNSPDFTDEKMLSQSGIAMRYKLVGFENISSNIVANMTKALQKRIELICAVLRLTNGDNNWRDV
jgi:SPP1 family phage portal protein